MAPVIILLVSLAIFASFYHLLPAEVAVHFDMDGNPDNWLSPPLTGVAVLAPQLLFLLMAWGIAWVAARLGNRFGQAEGAWVSAERVVVFMGNILALPQVIILFAMLDILSYNAYQAHILPMWLFLIVVLGLATIALVVLAVFIYLRARKVMSQTGEQGGF
jgi:uncharacterized membrane protein